MTRERYSHELRVTKDGWYVVDDFEGWPKLALIAAYKNYELKNDPDILQGIRNSFTDSDRPCIWCEAMHDVGIKTCLFCKRQIIEVELIPQWESET